MITRALCNSFKTEILRGIHQEGDLYKVALFTALATLSKATTVYDGVGEVAPSGDYITGGQALAGFAVTLEADVALLDWAVDPVWGTTTVTARGALVYNASRGNRAVAVLDFGGDISSTNGPFTIELPAPNAAHALIRID